MGNIKELFTLQEELWIEEILNEAHQYGLRNEVKTWAEKEIQENPEIGIVEAYQTALLECTK